MTGVADYPLPPQKVSDEFRPCRFQKACPCSPESVQIRSLTHTPTGPHGNGTVRCWASLPVL